MRRTQRRRSRRPVLSVTSFTTTPFSKDELIFLMPKLSLLLLPGYFLVAILNYFIFEIKKLTAGDLKNTKSKIDEEQFPIPEHRYFIPVFEITQNWAGCWVTGPPRPKIWLGAG
jgi:hypothetical protein